MDISLAQRESSGATIVPDRKNIFAALSIDPSDVSVVVIGQDPYPTPNQATGLAFAVPPASTTLPGSLRNIFKEIESDTGKPSSADGSLRSWVDQGILLLNTSLTTEVGARSAHESLGWRPIVEAILTAVAQSNPRVVALLWGNHAKQFSSMFKPECVVYSVHPSPLSANRGFFGSRVFTKVNKILGNDQRSMIIW